MAILSKLPPYQTVPPPPHHFYLFGYTAWKSSPKAIIFFNMKNIFYKIFMLDLDPEPGLEIIRMMSSTLEKINSSHLLREKNICLG